MSQEYWLADADARVLGPLSLEVIRDLALKGKLAEVRAISRDGKAFAPAREVPEIHALIASPPKRDEVSKSQAQATQQIREWLDSVKDRQTNEVFRLAPGASRDAHRAAFFSLVQRYVPSRLPADATAELRLACEDAFLFLAERMVEVERASRTKPPSVASVASQPVAPRPEVTWRGGMIHVVLALAKGDARPFTIDPQATWRDDCLTVESNERMMVGTLADVSLTFEGHLRQIQSSGRVVGLRSIAPFGFSVKLLDLSEDQRSMIRTWVVRADR